MSVATRTVNLLPRDFRLQYSCIPHIAGKYNTLRATHFREIQDYLKGICPDLHIVKGEFDEGTYPETKVLQIGAFKIGVCHGHQ
eukprot:5893302-Pyramimonas_sp.AAC.1